MSKSDGAGPGVLCLDGRLGIELFLDRKTLTRSEDLFIGVEDVQALLDAVAHNLVRTVVVLVRILTNSTTTISLIVFW